MILRNDSVNRCFWKFAEVVELHHGRDDRVRAATVEVTRGTNSNSVLRLMKTNPTPNTHLSETLSQTKQTFVISL